MNYEVEAFIKRTGIKESQVEEFHIATIEDCNSYIQLDIDGQFIHLDEFTDINTLKEVLELGEFISCCGDLLDKDIMICPSCKEHC